MFTTCWAMTFTDRGAKSPTITPRCLTHQETTALYVKNVLDLDTAKTSPGKIVYDFAFFSCFVLLSTQDAAVQGWLKTPIDRRKLGLAITATARTYAIPQEDSDDEQKIGVRIIGDGKPGPLTLSNGTLAYAEVCRMLISATYTVIQDPVTKVPHAYSYDGDLWFSYENEQSVKDKASYTLTQRMGGGVMIFASDQDGENWSFHSM